MNCPKCQAPVSADWIVCPKCGATLNQLPFGIPLTEVKRPSAMQYLAGIAIIIVTTIIAIALLISGALNIIKPDMSVTVPGTRQLELNETGYYILFCEEQDSGSSCDAIEDMEISLYDSYSDPVELSYPSSDIEYTVNDISYTSVYDFWVDETGTYTLVAEYDEGESGPDAVLAMSNFNFMSAFMAPFAIGTIGFIIGLIIIIRAAMKRRSISSRSGVTPVDKFWC